MSQRSLEDELQQYDDKIEALRHSDVVENPTPDGRPTPLEYTNWFEEQLSWKETCYIGDWSFMPDLHVTGPDVLDLFSDLTVNTFEDFKVGKVKHAAQCNEDGKVIGDGIMYRVGEEEVYTQHLAAWPMFNAETKGYDVTAEIHDSFIYQVQGPNSLYVLEELTDAPLRDMSFMNVQTIDIAGRKVRIIRQGMSGEVGFELQGPQTYGDDVWEAVVEAGQDYGLRRLGRRTHMLNHLEMCFATRGHHYLPAIYGDEMAEYREWLDAEDPAEANFTLSGSFKGDDISDWYRSPVELGWGRSINFDHDFIGKEALKEELENPERRIVTLEWDAEDVIDVYASLFRNGDHYKFMDVPYQRYRAIEADSVRINGEEVGVSTGRGYSYYFNTMISLCVIDREHAERGKEVTILWGEGGDPANPKIEPHTQKEITATMAPAPYKEDRRRTDLNSL
jgi:vanillate/3-O-methylgallate O-demethylase